MTLIAWSALLTVSEFEPLLGSNEPSPANEAPTPVGYEPALIPARLTPLSVATPLPFVLALPTLRAVERERDRLAAHAAAAEVSVAESVVVPPNVPVAGAAARLVALVPATSLKQTCTLESVGVTAPFVVVRIALYFR